MKNVIVLSCNTGQGHNSCAEAVREYLEEKNISCRICDSLSFISPAFSAFLSWGHSFMYRHIPGLFRWGYGFNEKHRGMLKRNSLFYRVLTSGAGRLARFILDGGYDTVICTHVFPALAVSKAMSRTPMPVRTAYVATDYTCSPGTESSSLDHYFIPCKPLLEEFQTRLPSGRIAATGIPVRGVFWRGCGKEEAREKLHIGKESRHLLMMCGSMGCGPIVKLLRRLTGQTDGGLEVTVICGTNQRLREKLQRRYGHDRAVHIVGYTEDVSLYMDSADLYLTKPGGISVTEAAARNLPMAFINPVSGCEDYNMNFFVQMGAAVSDTSVERLAEKCLQLLFSGEQLGQMRRALEEYGQPNGAALIYEELSRGTQQ